MNPSARSKADANANDNGKVWQWVAAIAAGALVGVVGSAIKTWRDVLSRDEIERLIERQSPFVLERPIINHRMNALEQMGIERDRRLDALSLELRKHLDAHAPR